MKLLLGQRNLRVLLTLLVLLVCNCAVVSSLSFGSFFYFVMEPVKEFSGILYFSVFEIVPVFSFTFLSKNTLKSVHSVVILS